MAGFKKEIINPVEYLHNIYGISCAHINFDPKLNRCDAQYQIIREQSSDGTLIFKYKMLEEVLNLLTSMSSYYKPHSPDSSRKLIGMRYTVGCMRLATVYGSVSLPAGRFPGERNRVRISVIADFVYADD